MKAWLYGTHSFLGYFWTVQKLASDSPRNSKAVVYEINDPFRTGHAVLLRLFGTFTIALGRWGFGIDPDDDEEIDRHLMRALQSASGTKSFLDGAGENWVIQNARVQAGEAETYEPNYGYLTGADDGPQENLGQVAEPTGKEYEGTWTDRGVSWHEVD